jgi:hypothetical protein
MSRNVVLKTVVLSVIALAAGADAALITQPSDPILLVTGSNDGDNNATPNDPNDDTNRPPPATEGVANAINGTTAKYLNFQDLNSGFIVTPQSGASVLRALRFYTANDAPNRDPASYLLEGSNAGDAGPFTIISTGALSLPMARNGNDPDGAGPLPVDTRLDDFQEVVIDNSASYTSYRLTFPTLRNAGADVAMQIGEVEFDTVPEPGTAGVLGLASLALLARRRRSA